MRTKIFFKKFIKYLLLFSLPIVISGIILISSSYREIVENADLQAESTFLMGTELTDDLLSKGSDITVLFNNSSSVSLPMYKMLSRSSLNYKEYIARDFLSSIINNSISNFDYVESMYVYFPNEKGNYFHSGRNVTSIAGSSDPEWYRIFEEHAVEDQQWIVRREIQEYSFSEPHEVISIFRRIKHYNGVLVTNLKASVLSGKLNSIGNYRSEVLAVINDDGDLLFSNLSGKGIDLPQDFDITDISGIDYSLGKQTSRVKIGKADYVANVVSSPNYSIHFISLVPVHAIYGLLYSILLYVAIGESVAILLCLLMCYVVTKRSYERFSEVLRLFRKAEEGTFDPATDSVSAVKAEDEYNVILNQVIDTFIKNSLLNTKIHKTELNKTLSELKALQLEINPHFFFNTLQLIDMEIIKKEGLNAPSSLLLHQLSDILRYSLDNSEEAVPLADEIRITRTYAEIQSSQHPGQISLLWDYNDSITDTHVMRLLLQPLIENSIRYSILTPDDHVVIRIKILDKGDRLSFHVLDTGPGLSAEHLSDLRSTLGKESPGHHIGLKNTHKRLLLSSDKSTGLNIISTQGRGTCILFDYYKDNP